VNAPGNVPKKSLRPTVSSSYVSSTGQLPASTIAHVVPANPPTLVFGPPGELFQLRPGMSACPRASLSRVDPTYRLRYHSARPPRSRTPCTIPSR